MVLAATHTFDKDIVDTVVEVRAVNKEVKLSTSGKFDLWTDWTPSSRCALRVEFAEGCTGGRL